MNSISYLKYTKKKNKIQMFIVEVENTVTKRKCTIDIFKSKLVVAEQNIGKLKDQKDIWIEVQIRKGCK